MNDSWKRDFRREWRSSTGLTYLRARDIRYRWFLYCIPDNEDFDWHIERAYSEYESFKKSVYDLTHQPQMLNPPNVIITNPTF